MSEIFESIFHNRYSRFSISRIYQNSWNNNKRGEEISKTDLLIQDT